MAMSENQHSPWRVAIGAALGLVVGNGPVMQFTFGVFLKPLSEAFQTDRGTISGALLAGLVTTGLCTPLIGRMIDRRGVRAVALPAIVLFSLGVAALGWLAASPLGLVALYALAGVAAAGQTPLPYSKAIAAAFDRRRGLALGIAMAGVGVGTALLPPLAQQMIQHVGWRGAYLGLGLMTLFVAVPAMAFLVTAPSRPVARAAAQAMTSLSGVQALRHPIFWTLVTAFFLVAMAASGIVAHIVPLLTDRAVDPARAAGAISAAGLALIVGRLIAGWALDRVHAPYVALVFFALPLLGVILLLSSSGVGVAVLAAVLVGLGLGAEVDLIAYLQSRYFGLRAFGEIYGYFLAIFMLASGLGPFLVGSLQHRLHDYQAAFLVLGAGLGVACALMAGLRRPVALVEAGRDRRAFADSLGGQDAQEFRPREVR
jgi:MFS family permease